MVNNKSFGGSLMEIKGKMDWISASESIQEWYLSMGKKTLRDESKLLMIRSDESKLINDKL